jgi:hypothetical protein
LNCQKNYLSSHHAGPSELGWGLGDKRSRPPAGVEAKPHTYFKKPCPQIFRPSYGPVMLLLKLERNNVMFNNSRILDLQFNFVQMDNGEDVP